MALDGRGLSRSGKRGGREEEEKRRSRGKVNARRDEKNWFENEIFFFLTFLFFLEKGEWKRRRNSGEA